MKITRKDFLRIAGFTVAGAGAAKAVQVIGAADRGPQSPGTAKRWGMVIDFQKCRPGNDCDDCLSACRLAHNIPEIPEHDREVKWVWKERYEKVFPFQQTDYTRRAYEGHVLPVLCNQCAQPACVRVCPTAATWKREDGVVMMDQHRCIGCRYCMAACPYGSRSFNWSDPRPYIHDLKSDFPTRTKGVVEKCNFCEERLAEGRAPACVEACREKAIVFGDLNDEQSTVRQLLRARYAVQRMPELGTGPSVFYLV
ncbi:MAG: sulfate reduction electron transfer complex DsrMKJOP subunit DsrO [Terriglobales bacterium]|jgi:molybdopterin-containing oxidoreductase family iron-sulfur binding subunit